VQQFDSDDFNWASTHYSATTTQNTRYVNFVNSTRMHPIGFEMGTRRSHSGLGDKGP